MSYRSNEALDETCHFQDKLKHIATPVSPLNLPYKRAGSTPAALLKRQQLTLARLIKANEVACDLLYNHKIPSVRLVESSLYGTKNLVERAVGKVEYSNTEEDNRG